MAGLAGEGADKKLSSKMGILNSHHNYYFLTIDGKKTDVFTYLSHGKGSKDYGKSLMGKVKKQLRFTDSEKAELFLDCPMSYSQYVEMLKSSDAI